MPSMFEGLEGFPRAVKQKKNKHSRKKTKQKTCKMLFFPPIKNIIFKTGTCWAVLSYVAKAILTWEPPASSEYWDCRHEPTHPAIISF